MRIRAFRDEDRPAVVDLSLRAWAPVFVSIEAAMNPEIYRIFYPDWREAQAKAVSDACADAAMSAWVAEEAGRVAGFVVTRRCDETLGEIYMVAVDPDFQKAGIGRALADFAVERLKEAGASIAMVETGADPGHAPARRTYEKAGFEPLHAVRYFKKI